MRIAIISNAGGSGKTTTSIHLGYELAMKGKDTLLMDLDPQGSLSLFCGMPVPEPSQSLSMVLNYKFAGEWPCVSVPFVENLANLALIPGGMSLTATADELVTHKRGAYLLSDRLTDYPLSHEVIIFDCPATLGPLSLIALTACTHIIIPVQLEPKSIQGAAILLTWINAQVRELRLNPAPKIVGVIPNRYNSRMAAHRQLLEDLPPLLAQQGVRCFPPIRESAEFVNASGAGKPLHLFRQLHPAIKDFKEVVEVLNGETEN